MLQHLPHQLVYNLNIYVGKHRFIPFKIQNIQTLLTWLQKFKISVIF